MNPLVFFEHARFAELCAASAHALMRNATVLLICLYPFNMGTAETVRPAAIHEFLAAQCFDCHQGEEAEASLDLEQLEFDLQDPQRKQRWLRIHDRVRDGEMPPPDYGSPNQDDTKAFLKAIGGRIRNCEIDKAKKLGRVRGRRLTRKQVERSLQDLLGIDIPLADQLPQESRSSRFTTVADDQVMSHFQLQSHLAVVDLALDEAFRRAMTPEDLYERDFDANGLARTNPRRRCREPEMRNGQAVIWNGGVIFYGRLPVTKAPEDGWYRFALTASAVKSPKDGGVWSTIRTGLCVSSAPLLKHVTSFEATDEPKTIEFEAWLPKGHMLEIRPGDATLKKGRFKGGQIGTGEGEPQEIPGIAFDRLTMTRFQRGVHDEEVRRLVFGDVRIEYDGETPVKVATDSPMVDAERLMLEFARRAYRRPVDRAIVAPYVDIVRASLERGTTFENALRLGYRAILCSPRFLYLTESPGPLDHHEVAARLSYFLTGSTPDEKLWRLADSESLLDPKTLRSETERLLSQEDGKRFIADFAAEWLDLEKLRASTPDRKRFREFDPVVELSMLEETLAFLQTLLNDNQHVGRLIDSDFTFLNSRLARYYDIEGVQGDELRRVNLPPQSHRGGVLTHGSILKVTANGSNTSPVLRGVWVSERLLGIPIPPPPSSVPAIEPDIRGATTIREQLAKHRSDVACASCHTKIDPAGFALENFDAAGQWRDTYRTKSGGEESRIAIDASYDLPDGRHFQDVSEFRKLVAAAPRQLAANVVSNLIVYATGGPINFSDREVVDSIVDRVAVDNFGLRSMVHAVVSSPIFLNK